MRFILKSSERRCCSTQFNIRAREGIAQAPQSVGICRAGVAADTPFRRWRVETVGAPPRGWGLTAMNDRPKERKYGNLQDARHAALESKQLVPPLFVWVSAGS